MSEEPRDDETVEQVFGPWVEVTLSYRGVTEKRRVQLVMFDDPPALGGMMRQWLEHLGSG